MDKCLSNMRVGITMMAVSIGWTLAAPWLSANKLISVWAELSSYWLCTLGVMLGGITLVCSRGKFGSWLVGAMRGLAAVCVLVAFLGLLRLSNQVFFFWKVRTIPDTAWMGMVSDLERVAALSAESRTNYLSGTKAPPKSLQAHGLGMDYAGGKGEVVNLPDYRGLVAHVEFGNKLRVWGIYVGSERLLNGFCPKCKRVRIRPNAFFYVGSRG